MNSFAASCSTGLMHHFDWIAHIVKQSINHACHKAAACMPTDQCALWPVNGALYSLDVM